MTITLINNQSVKTFALGESVVLNNGRRATVIGEPNFTTATTVSQLLRFSADDSVCPNGEWSFYTWGLVAA